VTSEITALIRAAARLVALSCAVDKGSAMDVTGDYIQDLSARQRDVMNLIVRGLSNKEIASILNLAEGLTAKECLQSAEVCLALAHKTKELDTRAALLGFAYEFRTVAKRLQRKE
jgi:FixJ family two-component response regulator